MANVKKTTVRRTVRVRVLQVALYFLVFFLMSTASLMIPLRPNYSEMEGRALEEFPAISLKALATGSYFDDINTWFADTFPGRDMWMELSEGVKDCYGFSPSSMEVHGEIEDSDVIPTDLTTRAQETKVTFVTAPAPSVGTVSTTPPVGSEGGTSPPSPGARPAGQDNAQAQSFGAILTIGDSGFEYYNFVESVADDYTDVINSAGEQLKGIADVYDMVVPTSMDICLDEERREGLNTANQKDAINYIYSNLNENVHIVDLYDSLATAHKNGEYLYFRTDHHWTAWGAYRSYEQMCAVMGRVPTSPDHYTLQEFSGYLGSFYRETQLDAMRNNPDIVQAFVPNSTNTMEVTWTDGSVSDYSIITDVTEWSELYKYNAFIGGDNPLSVVENPNKTDGSACVLIKESFGNAFAPFLVEDYQTVYIIDYRYYGNVFDTTLKDFVVEHDVEDVIFLNNVSATRNGSLVANMAELVG